MELAITEFVKFNDIPVKVSLNEYIDIAKFYSTKQSGNFINGILDKIIKDLKQDGTVKKVGMGLKGDIKFFHAQTGRSASRKMRLFLPH